MNTSQSVPHPRHLLLAAPLLLTLSVASGCAIIGIAQDRAAAKKPAEPQAATRHSDYDFPEAEQMMTPLLDEHVASFGSPPPTVLRKYLRDDDWSMIRDDFGTITERNVSWIVYYKGGESGQCKAWNCQLTQEEQRGSWGKPELRCYADTNYGDAQAIYTCESVESLPGEPPA